MIENMMFIVGEIKHSCLSVKKRHVRLHRGPRSGTKVPLCAVSRKTSGLTRITWVADRKKMVCSVKRKITLINPLQQDVTQHVTINFSAEIKKHVEVMTI